MALPATPEVELTPEEREEQERMILDSVDRFLEREVAPHAQEFEQKDIYPEEIVEGLKALGLFGAMIPEAYGGLGLTPAFYARVIERIAGTWMSVTGFLNSHLIMAYIVDKMGSEEQRQRYLPRFATGELRGGIGLTEPDCGTDLQAIRTVARRDGDDYVINGAKTWITNAMYGDCLALLVKTNPDADPRHKGMSMFLVEKGPGYTVPRKLDKIGYRGIDTAEILFEDYRVPAANLIGGEGVGLKCAIAGLELGRVNIAARGVGMAQRALDESVKYSQQRQSFGKPLHAHQAIALKLADMVTRVQAARLLTEQAANALTRGERADFEAGMAKLFASEAALENAVEAMRIHGAYGYSKEFPVERLYRDAPLLCIGEGTNEIQRLVIAKRLIEQNPI